MVPAAAKVRITGDGGKDIIRTDYYQSSDSMPVGVFDDVGVADEYIWGDWAYGPEGDANDIATTLLETDQYGNDEAHHRDKERWGDDDKIYGGKGDNSKTQVIWAGDGDDLVRMGYKWMNPKAYGQEGNDTIYTSDENIVNT